MIAPRIRMRCALNGKGVVQKHARPRHNPRTVSALISTSRRHRAHRIRAIENVIQTAPARIGSIEGITGIGDWNHKLWPRDRGDLRVNILRIDLEIRPLSDQIANFMQKGLVGGVIMRLATMRDMPSINLGLQALALLQESMVFRRQICEHRRKASPKAVDRHACVGQSNCIDKLRQLRIH